MSMNEIRKIWRSLIYFDLLLVVFAYVVSALTDSWIAFIPVVVVTIIYIVFCGKYWRCPHCKVRLGRNDRAKHCHNCGEKLDWD